MLFGALRHYLGEQKVDRKYDEKKSCRVMKATRETPPLVPLKNLQKADQQPPKDLRDTPLVPRGHGGGYF